MEHCVVHHNIIISIQSMFNKLSWVGSGEGVITAAVHLYNYIIINIVKTVSLNI